MRNLLLVEDNEEMAHWIAHALRSQGFSITVHHNGLSADQFLQTESTDLVILDLSLPGLDGLTVLQRLRQRGNTVPVLILTARNSVADRVSGLNVGADDYLPKPFDLTELEARVQALLRRAPPKDELPAQIGALIYRRDEKRFFVKDAPLSLTPREHAALEILFLKADRVVPKEILFDQVFAEELEINPVAIEVLIHRLRKKLLPHHMAIVTLRGIGYLLKTSEVEQA